MTVARGLSASSEERVSHQIVTAAIAIPTAATATHTHTGPMIAGANPTLFGTPEPWVSMSDALGWGLTERPSNTLVTRMTGGGGIGEVLDGVGHAQQTGAGVHRDLPTETLQQSGGFSTCRYHDG